MKRKPLLLCILDGWGIAKNSDNNAIYQANPEFYNYILETRPFSQLKTSGEDVGLPDGQMGNSEVGHMTIGSGRICLQDLPLITKKLSQEAFLQENKIFKKILKTHQNKNSACHLIGLFSDGGIHSHSNHAVSIAEYLLKHGVKVNMHIIADGRDTAPKSILEETSKLAKLDAHPLFNISTIAGRFYAMDRDKRFERTAKALDNILRSAGKKFDHLEGQIKNSYSKSITDEFIEPSSHTSYKGVENGDSVIFYNFRPDRMRQITNAIINQTDVDLMHKIVMTPYSQKIAEKCNVLFPKEEISNTLGEIISSKQLSQLRISETEKYPHVTYFFNGGRENEFPKESRILVESPKVETYDLKPEMSAYEVTEELISAAEKHDFLLVNFANADMVGHTGNFEATKQAVKTVDESLKRLYVRFVEECGGTMIITADHGNAEEMFDSANEPITSHSTNKVPFILLSKQHNKNNTSLEDGSLSDIAPTILKLLDIDAPQDMIGKNLITKLHEKN